MTTLLQPVATIETPAPATVWALPGWAAQVDTHAMEDAIIYGTRVGDVPTLDDPPVTVDVIGADCFDLDGLTVTVTRRPFAVRMAEVRLSAETARRLAALLISAASLAETPL